MTDYLLCTTSILNFRKLLVWGAYGNLDLSFYFKVCFVQCDAFLAKQLTLLLGKPTSKAGLQWSAQAIY